VSDTYVHGYGQRERARLEDQAGALSRLLHSDTTYPPASVVLEVGCGTGAQTVAFAQSSLAARIVSIDVSAESLAEAKAKVGAAGLADREVFDEGIGALHRTAEADGVFCYAFFKAVGEKVRA
jgi:cyclopropane fatty-acyl-phospholipid synthase-like methyltransferase